MLFLFVFHHQLRRKKSPKTVKGQTIGAVATLGSSSSGQNRRSTDEMTESEDSDDNKKQTAKAENGTSIDDRMDIEDLLRIAATNVGKGDRDVSNYKDRLEEEWLSIATLRGRDSDFLARFMPFVLAEEVHRLLNTKNRDDDE